MGVASVRAQQEIFQGSAGCCTCNWRKTSLWCTADRPWPSRACYSARSPLGSTISVDASKLDLHAKGFGRRPNWLHLIPIDVPRALRYFIRHWNWSRPIQDGQVWPFDFTRPSFYGVRKWRTWDDDVDGGGDSELPLGGSPSWNLESCSWDFGTDLVKLAEFSSVRLKLLTNHREKKFGLIEEVLKVRERIIDEKEVNKLN